MCARGREIYMDPSWRRALAVAFAFASISAAAAAAAEPRVELFSPQGTIKQVRQVTARFTAPIVALGDPRLADPFTVDCAPHGEFRAASEGERSPSGKGRWADTRNWAYDFD